MRTVKLGYLCSCKLTGTNIVSTLYNCHADAWKCDCALTDILVMKHLQTRYVILMRLFFHDQVRIMIAQMLKNSTLKKSFKKHCQGKSGGDLHNFCLCKLHKNMKLFKKFKGVTISKVSAGLKSGLDGNNNPSSPGIKVLLHASSFVSLPHRLI